MTIEVTENFADKESKARIEQIRKANAFFEGRLKVLARKKGFGEPEEIFNWVLGVCRVVIAKDPSFSTLYVAVRVSDVLNGQLTDRRKINRRRDDQKTAGKEVSPEEIFRKIIDYSKERGIEPLQSFIGEKPAAASCLGQYLDQELSKS